MTASPAVPPSAAPPSNPSPPAHARGPSAFFSGKRRTPIYIGIAVVVVVLLLLLVLVLPSLFGSSSGSGTSPKGLTYDQARPIAKNAVSNYSGGGWAILLAFGYTVRESFTLPVNATAQGLSGSTCTFTPAANSSASITIPAVTANLTSGVASGWLFMFRNAVGNLSLVTVTGNPGTVLGAISGSACSTGFGLLATVPPNVMDSSRAAAAVANQSSAFRSAHPNATVIFGLVGGFSFLVGPEWDVMYTTCTPSTPSGTPGSQFNATVGGLNGTVLSYATSSVTCSSITPTGSSSTPLGSVLGVALFSEYSSGSTNLYNMTVEMAASGLTWLDTIPEITGVGGLVISSPWTLTATDSAGAVVATYSSSSTSWTGSPSYLISAGDGLTVSSPVQLGGDALILQGTGAYSGSIGTTL